MDHPFLVERSDDGDLKGLILKYRMRKAKKAEPGLEAEIEKARLEGGKSEGSWWTYGTQNESSGNLLLLVHLLDFRVP